MPYQQHDVNSSNLIPGGLALGLEQVGQGMVIECKKFQSGIQKEVPEEINRGSHAT